MRRQDPSQITGRHDPDRDWQEVSPTACHGLCPPRALGRPTLRGLETITTTKQGVTGVLTRRWAVGPAIFLFFLSSFFDVVFYLLPEPLGVDLELPN